MTNWFEGRSVLVTGGAGFIGSHLTDRMLHEGARVKVFDDLTSGSEENFSRHRGNKGFSFVRGSMLQKEKLRECVADAEIVFHLAASPDTRTGLTDTERDYRQNFLGTYMLLEAMRQSGTRQVIFASTSTVYGEASVMPTPENYGPLKPISLYGASKLACEAFVSAYCHMFGFSATALRLANVLGPRTTHGAVYDFYTSLRRNPEKLVVLGDGRQKKSYLYVDDCVEAFLKVLPQQPSEMEVYNVGSEDQIDVMNVARIVAGELFLDDVEFVTRSSTPDGRGWRGDVKEMLLDVSKMKDKRWKPRYSSADSVRLTVKALSQVKASQREQRTENCGDRQRKDKTRR